MSFFSFPDQVNERAARLVAGTVATLLTVALLLRVTWLIPVAAAGFLLRVGWGPRWSPLARAAMWTAARLGPPLPVAGPPKRFAQAIGAACTVTASVLFATRAPTAVSVGWGIVGMVTVFALLEACLAFCMGCVMYAQLQRAGIFPPNSCEDCGKSYRLL